jgi:hypothetical protein
MAGVWDDGPARHSVALLLLLQAAASTAARLLLRLLLVLPPGSIATPDTQRWAGWELAQRMRAYLDDKPASERALHHRHLLPRSVIAAVLVRVQVPAANVGALS